MEHVHILAISGSLREHSHNTALLRAAAELAPEGMTMDLVSLDDIPMYHPDVEIRQGFPAPVARLREQIADADAVIIATPEYNHSIPGVLKNALDWVSRRPDMPLDGKPTAIMGAATGMGGTVRAQEHLRSILIALNAHILNKPEVLIGRAHTKFDDNGQLLDSATQQFIEQMLYNLYQWTLVLKQHEAVSLSV